MVGYLPNLYRDNYTPCAYVWNIPYHPTTFAKIALQNNNLEVVAYPTSTLPPPYPRVHALTFPFPLIAQVLFTYPRDRRILAISFTVGIATRDGSRPIRT